MEFMHTRGVKSRTRCNMLTHGIHVGACQKCMHYMHVHVSAVPAQGARNALFECCNCKSTQTRVFGVQTMFLDK